MSTHPQIQVLPADHIPCNTADPNGLANPSPQDIQALVNGISNPSPHLLQTLVAAVIQQAINQSVNQDANSQGRSVYNRSNRFGVWNVADNMTCGEVKIVGRLEQKKNNSQSPSSIPREILSPQSNDYTVNVGNDYCLGNDGQNCTFGDTVINQNDSDQPFADETASSSPSQATMPPSAGVPNGNTSAPRPSALRKVINEDNVGCILSTGNDSRFSSVTIRCDGVQAGSKNGGRANSAPLTAGAAPQ
ncbi:hypothetical protein V5O48_008405, partial [Marasmius crinis-equi]